MESKAREKECKAREKARELSAALAKVERERVVEKEEWKAQLNAEQSATATLVRIAIPIVAGVVLKAVYKKGLGLSEEDASGEMTGSRRKRIRRGKFWEFGMPDERALGEFADMVSWILS